MENEKYDLYAFCSACDKNHLVEEGIELIDKLDPGQNSLERITGAEAPETVALYIHQAGVCPKTSKEYVRPSLDKIYLALARS